MNHHQLKLENPILKDFNQLVSLCKYANTKYYGDEDGDEEAVKGYIVGLKLIELFEKEPIRNSIGEQLDKLRYLEKVDETRFYNAYLPAVKVCSTEGAAWEGLNDASYRLLSRLKFRAFEEQVRELSYQQNEMAAQVRMLIQRFNQ